MELLKEILQIYMERREWFLELFGQHLKIAGIAIVLAGIMGLLLGIFIAEKEFMAPVILTLANIFYTIPSISLLGILIPFTGIGDKTAIIALTLYGLMPMIRNTPVFVESVRKLYRLPEEWGVQISRFCGELNFP